MAESILGLLFVTSSSSGRNIFRYPTDPSSPLPRLARPFYPSATYTAKDATVDVRPRRLFPKRRIDPKSSEHDSRGSSRHGAGLGLYAGPAPTAASTSAGPRSGPSRLGTSAGSEGGYSKSESESSDSSDEGDDSIWRDAHGRRFTDNTPRPSVVEAWDRRPSVADSEATQRRATPTLGDRERRERDAREARREEPDRDVAGRGRGRGHNGAGGEKDGEGAGAGDDGGFAEDEYHHALGFSLDFLSDLLTPPRAACNRMFEVCVDELVFVGHPVTIGKDGWALPADEDEDGDGDADGRRRGRRGRETREGSGRERERELKTVLEHRREVSGSSGSKSLGTSSGTGASSGAGASSTGTPTRTDDEPPLLTGFHLVLVFDKPDPQTADAAADGHANGTVGIYDEAYYEIAFKWTAAAFALQVRDNWVGREAHQIARVRDQAIADGVPITESVQQSVRESALARSLHALFNELHRVRRHGAHSLFSRLPTTFTVDVADIPIQVVLSPSGGPVAGHDADDGLGGDSDSDDDDDWRAGVLVDPNAALLAKQSALRVEPWHTLLLLDDAVDDRASDDAHALVICPAPRDIASRRGSKATVEEEDEKVLLDALVAACDATKPLAEIAHVLRFDLEGIVIPLARDLVQARRAILIDVVNTRLRTMVAPTPIDTHVGDLPHLINDFARIFPTLPPLVTFLSHLSASPGPIKDLLLATPLPGVRETYLRALTWLLSHDLVVQTHTRARLVARAAVKREAWVRLWRRRRNKWMRRRSVASSDRDALALGDGHGHGQGHGQGAGLAGSLAASLRLSSLLTADQNQTYDQMMAYDPDLEADSDVEDELGGGIIGIPSSLAGLYAGDGSVGSVATGAGAGAGAVDVISSSRASDRRSSVVAAPAAGSARFWADVADPEDADVPAFASGFIVNPARAQKDEARWIRVIRDGAQDAVMASQFDLCVQYFDGVTTFEEIIYRTGLAHRELEQIAHVFKDDLVLFVHP
ncbi:Nitrogen permease regulator 3 [Cryptotrichosporon argae]